MEDTISKAKTNFVRAKDRMVKCLSNTPDDKINWSPSPTARTPLQLVAHCGIATTGIHGMLVGKPFPYASIADLDASIRIEEKKFETPEKALQILEQTSSEYLAWLDAMTPDTLASTVNMPFGTMPMEVALNFPFIHISGHASQIEYIQTIYGDLDWHME